MFVKGYKAVSGEKHYMWLGNKISYHPLHTWIRANFGRPKLCEECKDAGGSTRKYHWANITGVLSRERSNWKRLCVKCHYVLDKAIHDRVRAKCIREPLYNKEANCLSCGVRFTKNPKKRKTHKFCSKTCSNSRPRKKRRINA